MRRNEYSPPTFQEAYEIEKKNLENIISPKYSDFEIRVQATARAFVRSKMRMNFHQTFEQGFLMGARWATDQDSIGDSAVRREDGNT